VLGATQQQQLKGLPYAPGVVQGPLAVGGTAAGPDHIVVVRQSELAQLPSHCAALIVVDGAPLSHPLIRELQRAVPMVLINGDQAARLVPGVPMRIDGATGLISSADLTGFRAPAPPVAPPAGQAVLTVDGEPIYLRCSVGSVDAVARAKSHGAEAIGLVRSEYLIPRGNKKPDANFYTRELSRICVAAAPLAVTVRLIDIAADKIPPWAQGLTLTRSPLGMQGCRLYDHGPVREAYLAQIAAIDTLLGRWPLRVLLPYVTHRSEFIRLRDEIAGQTSMAVPIGTMLETPAAALAAGELLEVADFAAIGCNDLMQCLFAADRDVTELRHLLDPYAPVLFRFLKLVANAASGKSTALQLCGLLPQLPGVLPLLVGLGFRAFSVEPVLLSHLAQAVGAIRLRDAKRFATLACAASDSDAVRSLVMRVVYETRGVEEGSRRLARHREAFIS
jgi:phosphoenolpyruvate-protein kinase (PTS system EI component)